MQIDSTKNPRIKALTKLWESGTERRARNLFIVEGARELSRALASGYRAEEAYVQRDLLSAEVQGIVDQVQKGGAQIIDVSSAVFKKIAVREERDGIVCVLQMKTHRLADLTLPDTPLLLAAENVENPGNVGALLRTADGAGVDAFVLIDYSGDLYNPHTIRASIGTVFSVPTALCTAEEWTAFCKQKNMRTIGASLDLRAQSIFKTDFSGSTAIVLGSEAEGLTPILMDACDSLVMIPMHGIADSLNVSVAGAVILYEAVRQRGQNDRNQ